MRIDGRYPIMNVIANTTALANKLANKLYEYLKKYLDRFYIMILTHIYILKIIRKSTNRVIFWAIRTRELQLRKLYRSFRVAQNFGISFVHQEGRTHEIRKIKGLTLNYKIR